MTSLGIGRELASNNIIRKIPTYPQDETVVVTPCASVMIAFEIVATGVPVNEPLSIRVSSKVSNKTIANAMATKAMSSSWGGFPFNLSRFRRNSKRDRFL